MGAWLALNSVVFPTHAQAASAHLTQEQSKMGGGLASRQNLKCSALVMPSAGQIEKRSLLIC